MSAAHTQLPVRFTPTQLRMLKVLADGLPHTKDELFACLDDELALKNQIRMHISDIRKKIRPHGHDIICELVNTMAVRYRHVRLLNGSSE